MVHLFHRYKTIKNTGYTLYQVCSCGKRRVGQPHGGGYQPIDWQWLETGKWTI